MKNLRLFENINNYNNVKEALPYPNITKVSTEYVDPLRWKGNDFYVDKYLTTTALTDGTITFTMYAALTVAYCTSVAYSLDDGQTWTSTNNVASTAVPVTVNVTAGQKVLWKAKATRYETQNTMSSCTAKFSSTCQFNVSGNAMSMLYEDDFVNKVTFSTTHSLAGLFKNCTGLINAQNLLLPATTLTNYCYGGMFHGCTSLINMPKLKAKTVLTASYANMFTGCTSLTEISTLYATTVGNYGCSYMFSGCTALKKIGEIMATTLSSTYAMQYMFNGCTSLVTAPKIQVSAITGYSWQYMFYGCTSLVDASNVIIGNSNGSSACFKMFMGCNKLTIPPQFICTSVGSYGYAEMFENCTALVTAPTLPATTLNTYCYSNMFKGCTSLINTTTLPAQTLADYCYQYMFSGCTMLTTMPSIAATTLSKYCYYYMFNGCSKLVNTTSLPVTSLKEGCYCAMFASCTSLVTAPDLPATTLVEKCYWSMFYGCTKLNYIKMLALNIDPGYSTITWVYNITTSGTFVMNSNAQWYGRGKSSIPINWNIQYDGNSTVAQTYVNNFISSHTLAAATPNYLKTTALGNGTITFTIGKSVQATTHLKNISWSKDNGTTWTTITNQNSVAKVIDVSVTNGDEVLWKGEGYNMMGHAAVSVNVTANNFSNFSSTCDFAVSGNILSLVDPLLMSNKMTDYCFDYGFAKIFSGCTHLLSAQNLVMPDSIRGYGCSNMFDGCTSLTTAPSLPATIIYNYCYQYMFQNCTALTTAMTTLPATTLQSYCYRNMFYGCTSLTTAPVLPATAGVNYAYTSMFQNCSSLNYIKCMLIYTSAASTAAHMTNWVSGVSATGTFVKNSASNNKWATTGVSGIPSGWTVQTAAS